MRSNYTLVIFLLFICLSESVWSIDPPANQSLSSSKKTREKVYQLIKQGWHYQKVENIPATADSLIWKAISLAEMTYDNTLTIEAFNAYLECLDISIYDHRRLSLIPKIESLLPQINDMTLVTITYCNIADVYRSVYNYDKAVEYSYKSLGVAELTTMLSCKVKSYISLGESMEGKNQLLEAFRNFLQAKNLAEKLKDLKLEIETNKVLSRFYHMNKDYDNAIKYKLKQLELLETEHPPDSLALMWLQYELEEISYNAMKTVHELNMDRLLIYAEKNGQMKLKETTLALYRAFLIQSERLDKLRQLYMESFPAEFEKMKRLDPAMYHRILALLLEKEGKTEEALQQWKTSDILLEKEPNKVFMANFNIRFGQFLKRQNKTVEAIIKFNKAWQLSHEAAYLDYAIIASEELESSYLSKGDFKNAYHFTRLHLQLNDSLHNMTKKDELLKMEIDNTARQSEENKLRIAQETERNHNLQYTAIIIILGVIFLVLIMLGSIAVPRWSIQLLGFISFILLFEFIILLADQKIHHFTHGEPWKILAIKIVLISIMLPLHHWIEKKVIHYLIHKEVVTFRSMHFRAFLKGLFIHEEPPVP